MNLNFILKSVLLKKIGFSYWHSGKDQKIKVSGDISKIIDLDEDWKEEKYEEEFKSGEYNFEIKTGYLWIYADAISPNEENWFYFPQSADKKLLDSDIIIIDKNKLKINSDELTYNENIVVSENSKFKIQVLDENKLYFRGVELTL